MDPLDDLTKIGKPYTTKARIEGMSEGFMDPFNQMAQEYYATTGKPLQVDDAFRTREMQAEGYRRKPTMVAPPGHSLHERGMAMDLNEAQAHELARMGLLEKYGFYRPMMSRAPGKKYEPWHIQQGDFERRAEKIGATMQTPDPIAELSAIGKSAADPMAELSAIKVEAPATKPVPAATAQIGPETKITTPTKPPAEITPEMVMQGAPEAMVAQEPLLAPSKPKSVMMSDDTYKQLSEQYPIFREPTIAKETGKEPWKVPEPERIESIWKDESKSIGERLIGSLASAEIPPAEAAELPTKKGEIHRPVRQEELRAEPLTYQQRVDRTIVQTFRPWMEKMAGLVGIVENALDYPVEKVTGIKMDRPYAKIAKGLVEKSLPAEFLPPAGGETLADMPASVAGGLLSYYTPGLPGLQAGASIFQKFLHNLGAFMVTDVARGYNEGGEEGAKRGLYNSVPMAAAFTLSGMLPTRGLQATGAGTVFAGAAYAGGETDPYKLTQDFFIGVGLDLLRTRGEAKREAQQRQIEDYIKQFKERNDLTDEQFDNLKGKWKEAEPTVPVAGKESPVEEPVKAPPAAEKAPLEPAEVPSETPKAPPPPKETVPEAVVETKPPYEMTKEEYIKSRLGVMDLEGVPNDKLVPIGEEHKAAVLEAQRRGVPIRPDVAEAYPEATGEQVRVDQPEPAPTNPNVFQDKDGWWRIKGFEDSDAHKFGDREAAEKVANRIAPGASEPVEVKPGTTPVEKEPTVPTNKEAVKQATEEPVLPDPKAFPSSQVWWEGLTPRQRDQVFKETYGISQTPSEYQKPWEAIEPDHRADIDSLWDENRARSMGGVGAPGEMYGFPGVSTADLAKPLKAIIEDTATLLRAAKPAVIDFFTNFRERSKDMWEWYKTPFERKERSFRQVMNNYLGNVQIAGFNNSKFLKQISKTVPDKWKRIGITNWIQADGDEVQLREWTDKSKGDLKRGYEAALNLTPIEKAMAGEISLQYENYLQRAQAAGVLDAGLENYVNQLWDKNAHTQRALSKLRAELNAGMLNTNFKYAKKRIFGSYFEGEQTGMVPKNKDIGFLVGHYQQAMEEAIAAREAMKTLVGYRDAQGKKIGGILADDGRPVLSPPAGGGRTIPSAEAPSAILIRPKSIHAEAADGRPYIHLDHPALRKYKWVAKDSTGVPVFMEGELWVHPDVYPVLKNQLGTSGFRQYELGRGLLKVSQNLKGVLLSGLPSPFHQVHLGTHAVFHEINPFTAPEIDFTNPIQRLGVRNGLMVYNHNALEQFVEGLQPTGIAARNPLTGRIVQWYSKYLFQGLIPRYKMKLFTEAYARNTKRYGNKWTEDQIAEITANQANAAFGELNYKAMGRNPTMQDAFRLLALAPDFLEARLRFAGQAIRPGGKEQFLALLRGSLAMYGSAVIANMLFSDDHNPHWDKPFTLVLGNKAFSLRSVPGDMIHLYNDPNSFIYHRLNPSTTKPLVEAFITGRDQFGRKRTRGEMVEDYFRGFFPIPLQGLVSQREQTLLQSVLQSMGVSSYKFKTAADQIIGDHLGTKAMLNMEPQQRQLMDKKKELVRLKQKGEIGKFEVELDKVTQFTAKQKANIRKRASDEKAYLFDVIRDIDVAVKAWEAGTPEEKAIYGPLLKKKINNLDKPNDKDKYEKYLKYKHLRFIL